MNRSGYDEWRDRKTSRTAKWQREITSLIRTAFDASDGTYGYRRIAAQLARWGGQSPTRPSAGSCAPQAWSPVSPSPGDPRRRSPVTRQTSPTS
ncbi:IS3 family transposase [Rathayibacter iranicus NCPPB 2253 = VKM Ac-1602]|nr:IS3 family transposase [Rathayibacter iranicus NCPPB 2253 = VKM Ac-1602]